MTYIIIGVVIVILAAIWASMKPTQNQRQGSAEPTEDTKHDYTNSYTPKWLFSYNEKDAFQKIKEVTDQHGLTLLAKVRLFDLMEPKKGCSNYKGAMWKIQAKHVDFVICDEKLVARYIIELDDGSHAAEARQERDHFVDAVLQNCGYKVIHTKNIDQATLETWISGEKTDGTPRTPS